MKSLFSYTNYDVKDGNKSKKLLFSVDVTIGKHFGLLLTTSGFAKELFSIGLYFLCFNILICIKNRKIEKENIFKNLIKNGYFKHEFSVLGIVDYYYRYDTDTFFIIVSNTVYDSVFLRRLRDYLCVDNIDITTKKHENY